MNSREKKGKTPSLACIKNGGHTHYSRRCLLPFSAGNGVDGDLCIGKRLYVGGGLRVCAWMGKKKEGFM